MEYETTDNDSSELRRADKGNDYRGDQLERGCFSLKFWRENEEGRPTSQRVLDEVFLFRSCRCCGF